MKGKVNINTKENEENEVKRNERDRITLNNKFPFFLFIST